MVLPFTKALLWLYVEGKTRREVKAQLDEISLPIPDEADLDGFEQDAQNLPISPGMRRRIGKKAFDEGDYKILTQIGYHEIYLKHVNAMEKIPILKELWEEVHRILRNPVMRVAIDVGTLCKYDLDELIQVIQPIHRERLTVEGLGLYMRYFFALDKMTKSDWRFYLRICNQDAYTFIRYHAALTKPREEALFLAGLPTKTAFTDFLKTVMNTAAYKFQYYSRHNAPQSDAQARHWAKLGFDAGVRHEKFSSTDVTDFSKTLQTEFEYTDEEIPTIDPDMLSEIRPMTKEEDKGQAPELPSLFQPETEV